MRKFLLLFFAMLFVSIGTWAAITISSTSISVGGTTYQGYGIYGAKAGEIAKLLSGDNSVTVRWNGATLDQLKSAEYIKVGDSQNPNVLKNEDLAALQNLSATKFLDIDGSTLAEGANIASIKAGSAIEAVTLPNNLTKEQVNGAGASLTACNPNFGSCLSLDAEMGEKEIYVYTAPCSSEEVEYTGTVTGGKGHLDNITCPLTFTSSSFTYTNTKFGGGEVTSCAESDIDAEGYVVPNPLKVELTKQDNPTHSYSYNGTPYPSNMLWGVTNGVTNQEIWNWGGTPNPLPPNTKLDDEVTHNYYYTYTWRNNYNNPEATLTYDGEPLGNETDGYYAMIENSYSAQAGYRFQASKEYNYTYTDPTDNCNVATASFTDGPHETIDVAYNQDVDLETKTITAPVEGGNSTAIAYVNKAGTLYKATSLDVNDCKEVDALVISGNINNGDISVGGDTGSSNDPWSEPTSDSDRFEPNGAIPAFYINNSITQIKSFDLSDCVIDDYKHLRVLSYNGNVSLEKVVFPKTLTQIPNRCCVAPGTNGCQHLSEIVFPTEAATLTIGDNAFSGTAITSLEIPGSVTSIGAHAFSTCPNLTEVEMKALQNNCTFGDYAFSSCGKLKHVTLSEKVQNISNCMFSQCLLLESVRIPSTCKTIGVRAFYECYDMHSITIPEGVEEILSQAFELTGLTDIYVMAKTPAKLPKIYAMSPTGGSGTLEDFGDGSWGKSTFTYQRTAGNNTVPVAHRGELGEDSTVGYDEVVTSWYQAEMSGTQGLGTGNALTALHYPDEMKPFFEGIDVSEFYSADKLSNVPGWQDSGRDDDTGETGWVKMLQGQGVTQADIIEKLTGEYTDDDGNTKEFIYLPQAYSIDPHHGDGSNPLMGPDKDGYYYPNQMDYVMRMASGATGTTAGTVLSAWGWRQFPLSVSIGDAGYEYFEKPYTRTWYTMCFPWHMQDEQLFQAFEQKLEMVEFVGAEMLNAGTTTDDKGNETVNYNLVFHFDKVVDTYYIDNEDIEYLREPDIDSETGQQKTRLINGEQRRLWKYTNKNNSSDVVTYPEGTIPGKDDTSPQAQAIREQYGRYLNIKNIMGLAGHPYMIHPAIGTPEEPATAIINGIKRKYRSDWTETEKRWSAENQKQERTVGTLEKDDWEGIINDGEGLQVPQASVFQSPLLASGTECKYVFIGNIDDYDAANDKIDKTLKKEMPIDNYHVVYYLGLASGDIYPKYYRKTSKGTGKWSAYSAIIVPDANAYRGIEELRGYKETISSGGAKAASIMFGEWEITTPTAIKEIIADAEQNGQKVQKCQMNVVYNINGQIVREGVPSVEGLPAGMYIVNGKKYMVK